jgi:multiple sugar transport system permease protein
MTTTTDEMDEAAAEPSGDERSRRDRRPRRGKRPRRRDIPKLERTRLPYGLIAPAVLFMVLIHILPMIGGWILSLKDLNTFTFRELFGAPWTGFNNYDTLLFDDDNSVHRGFSTALGNTVVYTTWTVTLTLGLGLGIALLLNRPVPGQRILRTLMLTPWVVPSFVMATLWQFMWRSDVGIINEILVDWTHLLDERPVWLNGPNSMWAIIIPSVWRGIPLAMLIFLAGLQAIPEELNEAASIDGAGPWRRFRYVTFPLIRPLFAVQLLFGVIYASYQFAVPWIMMGSNPGPHADLLMTLVVRESFSNKLVGLGAAASTLMMLGMLVWVAAWYRAFRRDLEVAR